MDRARVRPARLGRALLRTTSGRGDGPARALVAWDRRAGTGAGETWDGVAERLVCGTPRRISVDVFDTVLSRRVVGDRSIFWITGTALAAEGSWAGSAADFVDARRKAARARPNGTLEEIYAEHPLASRCRPGTGPRAEAAAERQLGIPVEGSQLALRRLRDAGHDLVFVSDMHLSRPQLLACLVGVGIEVGADDLVISSEIGASKWDGSLFPLLKNGEPAIDWHIGNDLWSDVAMAERAGVRAMPLKVAEPTELEMLMEGPAGSVGAAIAGAARMGRWSAGQPDAVGAALRETGADVAGQCLIAFLLWIRDECRSSGISQVVFLARDGELPFRLALAMPADHWDGLELQYLQGSRRLWSVAAAAVIGVREWLRAGTADDSSFVRQDQHAIPWGSLLARITLTPEDLIDHPTLAALPLEQPLPPSHDRAWRSLLADQQIHERISSRASEQYENLRQYLLDGGISAGTMAVVDVGWRGQLAWHISTVLRAVTGDAPVHLHFGGVNVAPEASQIDIRRFAFDDSVTPPPFPDVVSCVETFTASGHARAHGLERDADGRVRLVLDHATPEMDTVQRRLLWEGALRVARSMPSRARLERWGLVDDELAARVRLVLSTFWLTPSSTHALAAAHLAAEVDDTNEGIHTIASPYRLRERADASRTWRQGSLRLTRPSVRYPLGLLLALRSAARRAASQLAARQHRGHSQEPTS